MNNEPILIEKKEQAKACTIPKPQTIWRCTGCGEESCVKIQTGSPVACRYSPIGNAQWRADYAMDATFPRQVVSRLAGEDNGPGTTGGGRGPRCTYFAKVVGLSVVTVQTHVAGKKPVSALAWALYKSLAMSDDLWAKLESEKK